jgi:hypothetical protein
MSRRRDRATAHGSGTAGRPATPLTDAIDAVARVRGESADERWASTAAVALVLDDVRDDVAAAAVQGVAAEMSRSGEGPEDLYGSPREWVARTRREWADDGLAVRGPAEPANRELPGLALVMTAWLSFLFLLLAVITLGWGDPISLAGAVAPAFLGAVSTLVHAVYTRTRERRSHRSAVVLSVLTVLGVAGVGATLFLSTNDMTVAPSAGWWHLLATLAYGAVAARVLLGPDRGEAARGGDPRPDPAVRGDVPAVLTSEELTDPAWAREAARALRARADLTDRRVRQIVAEAEEHAHEAGSALQEEFGPPRGYAARFGADPVVAAPRAGARALAGAGIVLALTAGAVAVEGAASSWLWAWLVVCAANAAIAVVGWVRARRAVRPGA